MYPPHFCPAPYPPVQLYDVNINNFVSHFGSALNPKEHKRKMAVGRLIDRSDSSLGRCGLAISLALKMTQKVSHLRVAYLAADQKTADKSDQCQLTAKLCKYVLKRIDASSL